MQLDVYAVFARTTNYSLSKSPFENAGTLNLDSPYLCNKQFVLSILGAMEAPAYWRIAFAVTGERFYFLEAIALCFAIKPKKPFT